MCISNDWGRKEASVRWEWSQDYTSGGRVGIQKRESYKTNMPGTTEGKHIKATAEPGSTVLTADVRWWWENDAD